MLMVISPAKALDLENPLPTFLTASKLSSPRHLAAAAPLAKKLAGVGPDGLAKMMSLSDSLAELNAERFADWSPSHTATNSRPALLTFDGDVYKGLDAASFSARDFTWAQARLRILSGLYGLLRPLDLIQPYRLEMGTAIGHLKLADGCRSLPQYWSDQVFSQLVADLPPGEPKLLVNLASPEYAAAVDTSRLEEEHGVKTVTPRFCDLMKGSYKVVGLFSKKARGAMAGWIVRNRIKSAKDLAGFDQIGYRHDTDQSTPAQPVYLRDNPQDYSVAAVSARRG